MTYLRTTLTVVAALLIALLGPGIFWAFAGITSAKATGLAAVAAGLVESFLTPWFWILFISFFALFWYCSRLNSKPLRNLLLLGASHRDFEFWPWHRGPLHIPAGSPRQRMSQRLT
jgi:hypothetical protein